MAMPVLLCMILFLKNIKECMRCDTEKLPKTTSSGQFFATNVNYMLYGKI